MTQEQRRQMLLRRKRLNKLILGTVLGLSLVFGISAAALFLRLTAGPLDLHFADRIVRPGLQHLLGEDGHADFSRLELEWDQGRLRLRVADFAVRRPDGKLIAEAPGAYIGFSVFSLLTGHTEPSAIEVIRPVLAITIQGDGSVQLGGQAAKPSPGETIPVLGLLEPQFLARLLPHSQQPFSRGELSFLRLEDVTITVTDERWNTVRQFDPFTVDLERTLSQSLAINVSAPDRHGGWSVLVELGRFENGERSVTLETERFKLASFAPDLSEISVSETPVRAKLSTRLGEKGLAEPLTGEIELQAGHIEGKDFDVDFAPLTLKAKLEMDARTVSFSPAAFRFSGIEGVFSGRLLLPAAGDPTRPVRMELQADNLTFEDGERYPEISTVSFSGAYELSNKTLWIDSMRGGTPDADPIVELKGTANFIGTTPALKLTCNVGAISVAAAKALWPSVTVPPVRKWVRENIESGKVKNGLVEVAIPAGWLDGRPLLRQFVRTEWNLSGLTLRLKPDLPPVTGVEARVEGTGSSARVEAQDGLMKLDTGKIDMPTAVFVADELSQKRPYGRLNLVMVGDVPSLVEFAEQNDFSFGKETSDGSKGFQLNRLNGEGLANAEIRIPLWKDAKLDEATTNVEAELRNVSGENILEERDLKEGSFRVKIESGAMNAEGAALIDGIPFKLFIGRDVAGKTTLRAEADADEALRKKLGLDLAPWVTGSTLVRIVGDFSGEASQRIEIDLTAAKLSIPQLLFTKPAGQQALLSFIPRGEGRITELEDVHLRGKTIVVRGRIHLNEQGEASVLEFSEIKLRAADNFSAHIEHGKTGTKAQVTGRSIDMRPFLSQFLASSQSEESAPTEIELRVDTAIGANDESINNLRLNISNEGGSLKAFILGGAVGQGASLSGQVLADRGRPYLMITTNDGGALLRFLDIYSKVGGGRLTLTQTLAASGQAADGVVLIDNFRIVGEPAMQKLFGAAPQQQGGPKTLESDPAFERLRIAFTRNSGAIQVHEGVLRNAAIGITFRGLLNFRANNIDLNGSFIPMYALNNLMARLPVVGLFMGGQNEGLLGVTFVVRGPLSNPLLRINPVSAIAPGFLRGLFQAPGQQQPLRGAPLAPPQR